MHAAAQIDIPQAQLAAFCLRNSIRRLALFGSVLRADFTTESDVDVLVDFEPGKTPGLDFFSLQDELSMLLGRRVELNTPGSFGPVLRPRILAQAETIYGAD